MLLVTGLVMGWLAFSEWATSGFGRLIPGDVIRQVSFSTLLFIEGGIVLMTSLLIGFLSLPIRRDAA